MILEANIIIVSLRKIKRYIDISERMIFLSQTFPPKSGIFLFTLSKYLCDIFVSAISYGDSRKYSQITNPKPNPRHAYRTIIKKTKLALFFFFRKLIAFSPLGWKYYFEKILILNIATKPSKKTITDHLNQPKMIQTNRFS